MCCLKTITFVLENSNNYYKLELARSLLHFTEFDFTYFWEQCIAAGKIAYKTGTLPSDKLTIARTAVAKCHPYVEATLSTGFDSITIDCIIAYICSSEHIGLEELWSRCISPKNNYEQAIFRRISEYKTGRSINRWVNIVRMNEYARAKLDFIYDDPDGEPVTQEEAAYRREYFDLAFSVAANETGYSGTEMPYVRRYNPALLPGAAFQMGKISKSIYNRVSDALSSAKASAQRSDTVSDQNAMDVFSYIKNLSRPEQMDMKFVREAFGSLPDTTIYMPSGLKSLIDLEFDLIAEEGIMLVKCRNCGKYFIKDDGYDRPYCDRVGPTGKTCRETDTEFLRMKAEAAAAKAAAEAAEREAAAKAAAEAAEREAAAKAAAEAAAKEAEEKAAAERAAAEAAAAEAAYDEDIEEEYKAPPAPRYQQKRGTSIPAETEKRSQRIYNALYRRVGRIMDENEFREWSQYLSNLKRNVKNGECALTELDDFLDYSEGLYAEKKNAARARVTGNAPQPRRRASDDTPVGRKLPAVQTVEAKRFSPAVFERISRTPEKRGLSEDELFLAASEAGYSPAAGYPAGNDEDIHVKYIHSTEEFTEAPVRTMRGYTGYTAPAKPVYDEQPPAPEYPTYDNDVIPDRGAPAYSGKPYEADDTADNAPPEKEYKPFMPKKYASVYDAMMDASASGNDSNDDGYYGSYTPGGGIRKPDWDYLKK